MSRAGNSLFAFFWRMQCAAEILKNVYVCSCSQLYKLPEIANVFEISVAAQKNLGGFHPVCINATTQGKDPRRKFCPRTIIPISILGTPQFFALFCDPLNDKAESSWVIAQSAIGIKIFFIIVSKCQKPAWMLSNGYFSIFLLQNCHQNNPDSAIPLIIL